MRKGRVQRPGKTTRTAGNSQNLKAKAKKAGTLGDITGIVLNNLKDPAAPSQEQHANLCNQPTVCKKPSQLQQIKVVVSQMAAPKVMTTKSRSMAVENTLGAGHSTSSDV